MEEVDIAEALHDERLSIDMTPMSIEQATSAKENADVARAFYTDGGLKDGRGTAAYLEETNYGAHSHSEVIFGLCSSYRAERRALIAALSKIMADRR